jgi:hypothetical protein
MGSFDVETVRAFEENGYETVDLNLREVATGLALAALKTGCDKVELSWHTRKDGTPPYLMVTVGRNFGPRAYTFQYVFSEGELLATRGDLTKHMMDYFCVEAAGKIDAAIQEARHGKS